MSSSSAEFPAPVEMDVSGTGAPAPPPTRESWLSTAARELWAACAELWHSPRYSVPALLSLMLGVGASSAAFAVVSALLLRPLPFHEEDRLVEVGFRDAKLNEALRGLTLSHALALEFQGLEGVFAEVAVQRTLGCQIEGAERMHRVADQLVSPNYFAALGASALRGRLLGPEDGSDVVVIREEFWREAFDGAEDVIGRVVKMNDAPVTIVGVLPDEQARPPWSNVWWSQSLNPQAQVIGAQGIGRLRPGVSVAAAEARIRELTEGRGLTNFRGDPVIASVVPLRDSIIEPQKNTLTLVVAAVIAFLLLACANVATLLGTRASVRLRQRAIQAALGASRGTLMRADVLQALLLALLGGLAGLGLCALGIEYLNEQYIDDLGNTPARVDLRVALGFCGILTLCTLAGGVAPALAVRRVDPMHALRGEGRSSEGLEARRLRQALVFAQVSLSTVLLLGCALLVRSIWQLQSVDPGFDLDVITSKLSVPIQRQPRTPEGFQRGAREAAKAGKAVHEVLRGASGVQSAAVSIDGPFDWMVQGQQVQLGAGALQQQAGVFTKFVGPDYFETFGIERLSGSPLDHSLMPQAPPRPLVTRSFAKRLLGVKDATGHKFRYPGPPGAPAAPNAPWIEIGGMVEDSLEASLDEETPVKVYFPFYSNPTAVSVPGMVNFSVAVRAAPGVMDVESLLPQAILSVFPEASVNEVRTMQSWVERSYRYRTALLNVLAALGVAALVLAGVGLFGVCSYSVSQRKPELGIRRALGARRSRVVWMVLQENGVVVALGLACGLVLAYGGHSLLASFLFGVTSLDWVSHVGVAAGILAVAALALLGPVTAAARVSPMRAIAGR